MRQAAGLPGHDSYRVVTFDAPGHNSLPFMSSFHIETFIRAPRDLCFDLALDVAVHEESARFSNERLALPGRLEGRLEEGDLLTFEGRHFGLRQRFTTRITEVDRPRRFTDSMVKGVFKVLTHTHEFEERDGGTVMRDRLEWVTPAGPLGRLADRLFLARHMLWFVTTKQNALARIIESRSGA